MTIERHEPLTIEQVAVIRSISSIDGLSNAEIGRRMGRSRETIRDIVLRKTWKSVKPSDPELVKKLLNSLREEVSSAHENIVSDHR